MPETVPCRRCKLQLSPDIERSCPGCGEPNPFVCAECGNPTSRLLEQAVSKASVCIRCKRSWCQKHQVIYYVSCPGCQEEQQRERQKDYQLQEAAREEARKLSALKEAERRRQKTLTGLSYAAVLGAINLGVAVTVGLSNHSIGWGIATFLGGGWLCWIVWQFMYNSLSG